MWKGRDKKHSNFILLGKQDMIIRKILSRLNQVYVYPKLMQYYLIHYIKKKKRKKM
jgi:hypothetical protein